MINLFKKFPWLRHLVFSLSTILLIFSICLLPNKSFAQIEGKPLVVATEPTFPPFEFQANDGTLQGFDIDLIQEIGKQIGRPIEFNSLPFDGIIPALQANTIDAAVSGITVTKERAQTLAFSSPYFKAGLAIAVKENNNTINNFADLANKRIAVQIGTTGAMEAKKVPGVQVTEFDGTVLALQELVNGKVDAVLNDGPVTLYAIKSAGLKGVKVVGELLTEEFYAVALPQKSQDVKDINYGLFRILENGTYQSIYEKWFGVTPPQLPLIAPAMVGSRTSEGLTSTSGNSATTGEEMSVFQLLLKNLPLGVLITLLLTIFSVFFGLIGGTLIAMALISPSNIGRSLARIYVEFFRGTPMLVQLFIIYFGLPALFQEFGWNWSLDRFPAAIIALSLNVAAYLAEIIRGGIQSVDQGQWEACQSLGMTSTQTMTDVIFPQAFRRILPPLGNEFITLIKDTSLTAVIGFAELFRQGQLIVATTYQAFEVYIVVAFVYLLLTTLSSFVFKWLEGYMDPVSRMKQSQGI
jgi:arginine/lysine/histidine/glutamine transport system substrate-binding/permease protein